MEFLVRCAPAGDQTYFGYGYRAPPPYSSMIKMWSWFKRKRYHYRRWQSRNKLGLFGQAAARSDPNHTVTCAFSLSWFGKCESAIMLSSFKKSACNRKAGIAKTATIVCGLYIAKNYIGDRLEEVKTRLEQDRAARDRYVVLESLDKILKKCAVFTDAFNRHKMTSHILLWPFSRH